jgi:organic radical activating enzyme
MSNPTEVKEKALDMTKEAYFTEVFKSQQGEARFAGFPQIFVRFNSGCYAPDGKYGFEYTRPIKCKFCDEPQGSGNYREKCRIEETPNKRNFMTIPNPVSFDDMAQYILNLGVEDVHSVSLTGGEPTAFPDAIRALHNRIGDKVPFYLETNGIRPIELEEIIDCITYVVPDIKIPSVTGPNQVFWDLHKQFLDVCQKHRKHTTAKAVFSAQITDEEVDEIIQLVQPYFADPDFDFELTMQPVTPYGAIGQKFVPSIEKQFEVQSKMWKAGCPARVLPQTHKLTGHI